MAAPMGVTHKLLDGSSTSSGTVFVEFLLPLPSKYYKFCLKIHVHVIRSCQVNIDYHNQHESAALIGLFHATSSVLPSVESYQNYQKPTQRGVQGYLSSLQRRVSFDILFMFLGQTNPMLCISVNAIVLNLFKITKPRNKVDTLHNLKNSEKHLKTRAVLVFATERKNNVDPRLRSQKKVKSVQLFFAK